MSIVSVVTGLTLPLIVLLSLHLHPHPTTSQSQPTPSVTLLSEEVEITSIEEEETPSPSDVIITHGQTLSDVESSLLSLDVTLPHHQQEVSDVIETTLTLPQLIEEDIEITQLGLLLEIVELIEIVQHILSQPLQSEITQDEELTLEELTDLLEGSGIELEG